MATGVPDNENGDGGTARGRRGVLGQLVVFVLVAMLTLGTFLTADALGRENESGTPVHTVRDFLIVAVVDHDGVDACRYLTPHATRQAIATQPPNTTCSLALSSARLVLGSDNVRNEAAVKRLTYNVRQQGDRAWVSVSADGATRTFVLRKATANQLVGYDLPHSSWRIDSGVALLLRRPASGALFHRAGRETPRI